MCSENQLITFLSSDDDHEKIKKNRDHLMPWIAIQPFIVEKKQKKLQMGFGIKKKVYEKRFHEKIKVVDQATKIKKIYRPGNVLTAKSTDRQTSKPRNF